MKIEMFDIVNRNYRATRYIEKNKREERDNAIALLLAMISIAIFLIALYA